MITAKRRLGNKLAIALVGILLVFFVGLEFFISRTVKDQTLLQLKNHLVDVNKMLAHAISPSFENANPSAIHEAVHALTKNTNLRLTMINPAGVVLGDSERTFSEIREMDNHKLRAEINTALKGSVGSSIRRSPTLDTDMLYVATPLTIGGKEAGVLRTALPLTHVKNLIIAVRRPILIGSVVGILLVILVGIGFNLFISKRLRRLTNVAESFERGDFSKRIALNGEDELLVLSEVMNHMAASLKERIEDADREKTKLSVILNNVAEGIMAIDHRKRILFVNAAAERFFGSCPAPQETNALAEYLRNSKLLEMAIRALEKNERVGGELELSKPARTILSVQAVGFKGKDDEPLAVLVFHDVTEIRKLENVRKEFVANVSHELKTPLTSIKGFIETMLGGALRDAEKGKKFLEMMEEDATRLERLINDVLELSKVESSEITPQHETLELSAEVEKALSGFEHQINAKQLALKNQISKRSLPKISADRDQLRQVLINLIDNAIKFSHASGVITLDAEAVENRAVKVSIQDTGAGIPPEAIPRVFERFFRVDKARSRELGGTGLGLSIVKHIVEAHGGTVSCQSSPGEGSIFTFTLPAA